MLVRDVKHTMLVKVPQGVDPKDAVLFDVICVSLHGVRNSAFKFGDNVVVSGTGPIGLAAIQCLKAAGANKIIALGTTSSKEPIIKAYGADYFINSKECEDLAAEVQKILGNEVGADVVYECSGQYDIHGQLRLPVCEARRTGQHHRHHPGAYGESGARTVLHPRAELPVLLHLHPGGRSYLSGHGWPPARCISPGWSRMSSPWTTPLRRVWTARTVRAC